MSKVSASQALQFPLAGPNLLAQAADALLRQMPTTAREYAIKYGLLTVTCDSSAVLKDILANSDAISVMSLFVVIKELRSGELTIIRDLDLGVGAKFGITHLRSRSLSAPAEAFIKILIDLDRTYVEMEQSFLQLHSIADH